MSHVDKIHALLEARHGEQAAALILAVEDPDVDTFVLEQCDVRETGLPFHAVKYNQLRPHRQLGLSVAFSVLARASDSKLAKSLIAQLETCVVKDITDMQALSALSATQSLAVLGCKLDRGGAHPPFASIENPSVLSQLPALESLSLVGFRFEGKPIELPPHTEHLRLLVCQDVSLTKLAAGNVDRLLYTADQEARTRTVPPSVRILQIDHMPELVTLKGLEQLTKLEEFWLHNDPKLADLSGLATAIAEGAPLRKVVCHLAGLESIEWLRRAESLESLDLKGCRISSLAPLEGNALQQLSLVACAELETLEGLPQLTQAALDLSECKTLCSIAAIAAAPNLETLDLRGCAQLRDIEVLLELPELKAVALARTPIEPADLPASLRRKCSWASLPDLELMARYAQAG